MAKKGVYLSEEVGFNPTVQQVKKTQTAAKKTASTTKTNVAKKK